MLSTIVFRHPNKQALEERKFCEFRGVERIKTSPLSDPRAQYITAEEHDTTSVLCIYY